MGQSLNYLFCECSFQSAATSLSCLDPYVGGFFFSTPFFFLVGGCNLSSESKIFALLCVRVFQSGSQIH